MKGKGCTEALVCGRKSVGGPGVSPKYASAQHFWPTRLSRLLVQRTGVPAAGPVGLSFISLLEQRCRSQRGRLCRLQKADLEAKQEGLRCSTDR